MVKGQHHSELLLAAKGAISALNDRVNVLQKPEILDGHLGWNAPVEERSWWPHVDLQVTGRERVVIVRHAARTQLILEALHDRIVVLDPASGNLHRPHDLQAPQRRISQLPLFVTQVKKASDLGAIKPLAFVLEDL